jgi:hypothetical protein
LSGAIDSTAEILGRAKYWWRAMMQFWTVVKRDGSSTAKPIFGRDRAVDTALEMLAKGVAVKFISPITTDGDSEMIGEIELRRLARQRGFQPKLVD